MSLRRRVCDICHEECGKKSPIRCCNGHVCHLKCYQTWWTISGRTSRDQCVCETCKAPYPPHVFNKLRSRRTQPMPLEASDEETKRLFRSWGYQPCPSCGIYIERISGCSSVQCTQCYTRFNFHNGQQCPTWSEWIPIILFVVFLLCLLGNIVRIPAPTDLVKPAFNETRVFYFVQGTHDYIWIPEFQQQVTVESNQTFYTALVKRPHFRVIDELIGPFTWRSMPLILAKQTRSTQQQQDFCTNLFSKNHWTGAFLNCTRRLRTKHRKWEEGMRTWWSQQL